MLKVSAFGMYLCKNESHSISYILFSIQNKLLIMRIIFYSKISIFGQNFWPMMSDELTEMLRKVPYGILGR